MARKRTPDYRDMKVKARIDADGKREELVQTPETEPLWWAAPEGRIAESAWKAAMKVKDQGETRIHRLELYAALYGDRTTVAALLGERRGSRDNVTLNVCRMAVDTLGAKVAKSKPKATFVTDGGNWGAQRRARALDKFVFGAMLKAGAYSKGRQVFRDACVWDLGALKWFRKKDKVCCERAHPSELLVDEADGLYGEPRTMYQARVYTRDTLRALYPHAKKAVDEASAPSVGHYMSTTLLHLEDADLVEVVEGWHLPSDDEATDGMHVLITAGGSLLDDGEGNVVESEPWRRQRFPFSFFRFSESLEGFYGSGVIEQLVEIQRSINRKLRTVNSALRLMAAPQYWQKPGSETPETTLTNEVGIIFKSLFKPEPLNTGTVVPPQLLESIREDYARALELVGVSQLSVAAKKPAGIDSGVGLREYNDIESERFILVGQAWEEFHGLQAAQQILDLAEEAEEAGEPLEVRADGKRNARRIEWKDAKLDRDSYTLKVFPTSSLPASPHARRQAVQEMARDGLLTDPDEVRRLLDMPDLEESNSLAFAPREDIDALIERFLDGDDEPEEDTYLPPEPQQDLSWGIQRMQRAYLRARMDGAPESRLALLRAWMEQAQDLLASAAPPAPAGPPMPPGAPPLGAPPVLPPVAV